METNLQDIMNSAGSSFDELDENRVKARAFSEIIDTLEKAFSKLNSIKRPVYKPDQPFGHFEIELPDEGVDLREAKNQYEASLVKQALRKTNGHQARAAKLLKINATTLSSIIKRHGL